MLADDGVNDGEDGDMFYVGGGYDNNNTSVRVYLFCFQKYLGSFGYLSDASRETGPAGLTSKDDYVKALRRLQRMGNIPDTGVVDTRTLELLKRPRCGNKDEMPSLLQRRRRRYVRASTKWDKFDLTYR